MNMQEPLRLLVAQFFDTTPDKINAQFPLAGPRMQGSIARYTLDAAIRRRLGKTCREVHTAATYGELEAALLGSDAAVLSPGTPAAPLAPAPVPAASFAAPGLAGLACGVDIEMVEALPETADYWTHPFYQGCFTPAEIAYCLTQENPRMHFAGRWCAKEAAKKCMSELLPSDMNRLEVAREASGAVFLQLHEDQTRHRLPLSISISHTVLMAAAIVVAAPPAASQTQE